MTSEEPINLERARQALQESRERSATADIVVEAARREVARTRKHGAENHYRDKFRAILKGTA